MLLMNKILFWSFLISVLCASYIAQRIAYDAYYVAYYGQKYTRWKPYPPYNMRPNMPPDRFMKEQRQDLMELMTEMLKEVLRTRKKMEPVRRVHQRQLPYQIGFILGIIREAYQRMMNMFQQAKNRYLNRDPYLLPTMFYGHFVNLEYFLIMEDIHYNELKINRLVDLIENTSLANFEAYYVLRRTKQQTEEADDILRRMNEIELSYKREMRRRYQMQRFGRQRSGKRKVKEDTEEETGGEPIK